MFARKYQRIAADYASKGAIFLEILGDETSESRVNCSSVLPHALLLPINYDVFCWPAAILCLAEGCAALCVAVCILLPHTLLKCRSDMLNCRAAHLLLEKGTTQLSSPVLVLPWINVRPIQGADTDQQNLAARHYHELQRLAERALLLCRSS